VGVHVAAGRKRQPAVELRPVTGQQIFAKDGSIEDRALYNPYYKGFEPRLGAAWKFADKWVARGGYGISQFMEGTGANLRLPLNPPFFFESAVTYDVTTGAASGANGFADLTPGTKPSGNVRAYDPNLRPQFTQQWNVFVERELTPSMSGQIGYVGHHADDLVTPVEGNQALPGVGDPSTWAPKATRRPLYKPQPLITTVATTASRGGSRYNAMQASLRQRLHRGTEVLVSYTLGKVTTNNRGFYGVFGGTGPQGVTSATEGAYWQNTYNPDAEWGPAFHDVRHNLIVSGVWELPTRKRSRLRKQLAGRRRCGVRRMESRRDLPGALGPARDGHRRTCAVVAGRARVGAAEMRRRLATRGSVIDALARHQRVRGRPARHVRELSGRRRSRAGVRQPRCAALEALLRRGAALRRVPRRGVQRAESSQLRSARARHLGTEHVRNDYDHGQLAARDRTGVQVFILNRGI
jgi:hypothetical protein